MSNAGAEILRARKAVVSEALKEVGDGMTLGLGSGNTMKIVIEEIGKIMRERELRIEAVPSSYQSMYLAINAGIPLSSLEENSAIDLMIDSFDQADRSGNAIKGGGGALTREKIICHASEKVIFVGDELKIADFLHVPVPLEVLPFALAYVKKSIEKLGGRLRLREGLGKVGPIISDNGNFISDADFGKIKDPKKLEESLQRVPGIIENGLFVGLADALYIGYKNGQVKKL